MLFFTGDAPAPFPCLLDDPDHDKLLEEQIAMGWGNTDQDKIPDDWRERRRPEKTFSLERILAIREGRRRQLRERANGINSASATVAVHTL